ncbi:hypothetical protein KBD49_04275 [Myxococcota bacterium]|nr:hypothetical protein [Myxococcota bacterium]
MAPTVLWSRNRGVQAMVRVVLARRGDRPQVVETLAALRAAVADRLPGAVITTDEDLEGSGLDAASLDRLLPGIPALVVCSGRRPLPAPAGPRMRMVPLPFSATDLLEALPPLGPASRDGAASVAPGPTRPGAVPAREIPPVPSDPSPPVGDLQALVRGEVRTLLETTLREWIQRTVREVVPELAESLIREELERLLRESEESALQGPAVEDPEARSRN